MKIYTRSVEKDVLIAPLGDIQYGNEGFSKNYLTRYLNWVHTISKENKAKVYFIGTGDYIDLMSPSNRDRYKKSGLYSSATRVIQDRTVIPLMSECAELLEYTNGKFLAFARGHHWMHFTERIDDEYDTDSWLATSLQAPAPFEGAAIIRLEFPSGRKYRIHATHGQGNSQAVSYGLNKLARQAHSWENIDAFVMGHTHKLGLGVLAPLSEEGGELKSRQIPLITSGAFLRSYVKDITTYSEEGQMWSLALGASVLRLTETGPGRDELFIQPMFLL